MILKKLFWFSTKFSIFEQNCFFRPKIRFWVTISKIEIQSLSSISGNFGLHRADFLTYRRLGVNASHNRLKSGTLTTNIGCKKPRFCILRLHAAFANPWNPPRPLEKKERKKNGDFPHEKFFLRRNFFSIHLKENKKLGIIFFDNILWSIFFTEPSGAVFVFWTEGWGPAPRRVLDFWWPILSDTQTQIEPKREKSV